ncbi:PFK [Mytilus edulis]|uniref:6-phosphofructokinase n=1 Tax=Mytilus edulis TaxID=6550 RepID=A0A8S3V7R6_MYTED|nr:PFK [Mytilus edulis]
MQLIKLKLLTLKLSTLLLLMSQLPAQNGGVKRKASNNHYTPETRAKIAKYATEHGNVAAARKFSKDLQLDIKESAVRAMKKKYLVHSKESNHQPVNALTPEKRGRPLLLGDLDKDVAAHIRSIREAGGIVNQAIVIATARGLVKHKNPTLLSEAGGSIHITKTWAVSFLKRLGYVKRKGTKAARKLPVDFEQDSSTINKVDLRLSVLKPLHAKWLSKVFHDLKSKKDIILLGWKKSGISDCIKYLALVAALATEADWVLIPECPPDKGWEKTLCKNCQLGHYVPFGTIAVKHQSYFSGKDGNQTVRVPLMECVERTKSVQEAMNKKNFQEAVRLRGKSFQNNLATYLRLSKLRPPKVMCDPTGQVCSSGKKLAVMNIGAPACGANAAVRSFVRFALTKGYTVLGIHDSFDGLLYGDILRAVEPVKPIGWTDVHGWTCQGGSLLGTKKCTAARYGLDKVAEKLKEHDISGLLIIGGFEAYHSALQMTEARSKYDAFCIPMVVIPCTISNNVPRTDFSLGADTALNEIADICDRIKQSATGTKRRVFIVEVMGGYCGYLATMAGLAGGADAAYIYEDPFNITNLRDDVIHLKNKIIQLGVQRGLILRNENANANYTTDFIHQMFSEEGKGSFTCRKNVLGHMQQGGVPSPFDRNYGTKMASKAVDYMITKVEENTTEDGLFYKMKNKILYERFCSSLGYVCRRQLLFTPLEELREITDFEKRLPKQQWWLSLVRPLLRIMAKHSNEAYRADAILSKVDFEDDDNA